MTATEAKAHADALTEAVDTCLLEHVELRLREQGLPPLRVDQRRENLARIKAAREKLAAMP